MKKVKYTLFVTMVLYSCANSNQKDRIFELEEENGFALKTIDSLKQEKNLEK